jgi:ATP-dependent DNA helicase RecG
VTYHRRTGDEIDRKMVATINELGQITNGVVQALFDVKVERASRILSDMVVRSILVKTSPHTRGPRFTYGPGPTFPSRKQSRPRRGADGNAEGRLPFEDEDDEK